MENYVNRGIPVEIKQLVSAIIYVYIVYIVLYCRTYDISMTAQAAGFPFAYSIFLFIFNSLFQFVVSLFLACLIVFYAPFCPRPLCVSLSLGRGAASIRATVTTRHGQLCKYAEAPVPAQTAA